MRNKDQLTQRLVDLLPDGRSISAESAMQTWWFNLRRKGGMRLTAQGYTTFVEILHLEHYSYDIDDPLTFDKHLLLKLDRKMQMPYYISAVKGIPKKIIFFGSREAVMLSLYGNLQRFLDAYSA